MLLILVEQCEDGLFRQWSSNAETLERWALRAYELEEFERECDCTIRIWNPHEFDWVDLSHPYVVDCYDFWDNDKLQRMYDYAKGAIKLRPDMSTWDCGRQDAWYQAREDEACAYEEEARSRGFELKSTQLR